MNEQTLWLGPALHFLNIGIVSFETKSFSLTWLEKVSKISISKTEPGNGHFMNTRQYVHKIQCPASKEE